MNPWIDLFVVALLPLAALLTVLQKDPYSAIVSRGILGVIAVLLFALMGAPDVALTEALVGTLLTVLLYVVTIRSTLVFRSGALAGSGEVGPDHPSRQFCRRYKLSLKHQMFNNERELKNALHRGDIDGVFAAPDQLRVLGVKEPAPDDADALSVVLAKHGKWHEKKMAELYADRVKVFRLKPPGKERH